MEDPRTLRVTNELSWVNLVYDKPYRPWASASFMNNGPSAVEVNINYAPHPDYGFTINPGKTVVYDKEPINIIFLRCSPGLNATVTIIGEPRPVITMQA